MRAHQARGSKKIANRCPTTDKRGSLPVWRKEVRREFCSMKEKFRRWWRRDQRCKKMKKPSASSISALANNEGNEPMKSFCISANITCSI